MTLKIRHAGALALVGRHRLLRGEVDLEIIILMVVSVFAFFGSAGLFLRWW
jgi:hypothetical protein